MFAVPTNDFSSAVHAGCRAKFTMEALIQVTAKTGPTMEAQEPLTEHHPAVEAKPEKITHPAAEARPVVITHPAQVLQQIPMSK